MNSKRHLAHARRVLEGMVVVKRRGRLGRVSNVVETVILCSTLGLAKWEGLEVELRMDARLSR